jgi:hypothetical protein
MASKIEGSYFPAAQMSKKPAYTDSTEAQQGVTSSQLQLQKETEQSIHTGLGMKDLVFTHAVTGDPPLYRMYRPSTGNHFFTTSIAERDNAVRKHGFRYEGIGFRLCSDGQREVFRLYNPNTKNHFFTASAAERDNAVRKHGFRYEGIGFRIR